MTPAQFTKLALSLPESEEKSHMGHPDFRVRGKIFATLGYPNKDTAVVRLTNMWQDMLSRDCPKAFAPVPGAWGSRGATQVFLKHADKAAVFDALRTAWLNAAPKKLIAQHQENGESK
jgi:hypothetical protein